MPNVSFHDLSQLEAANRAALMRRSETDLSGFMEKAAPIIEAVRTEGDAALVRFARDFDKADLDAGRLKVSPAE
ncbi:MAG: histidinol dehydrogenase, partial [Mesorhizobium sp.]